MEHTLMLQQPALGSWSAWHITTQKLRVVAANSANQSVDHRPSVLTAAPQYTHYLSAVTNCDGLTVAVPQDQVSRPGFELCIIAT